MRLHAIRQQTIRVSCYSDFLLAGYFHQVGRHLSVRFGLPSPARSVFKFFSDFERMTNRAPSFPIAVQIETPELKPRQIHSKSSLQFKREGTALTCGYFDLTEHVYSVTDKADSDPISVLDATGNIPVVLSLVRMRKFWSPPVIHLCTFGPLVLNDY